ncbi:MAG: MATE family efflux transporter [Phycisphaerales bacterium]|nr:MAG: MATE family efflux transporter [Phycisphaerales bacterium]
MASAPSDSVYESGEDAIAPDVMATGGALEEREAQILAQADARVQAVKAAPGVGRIRGGRLAGLSLWASIWVLSWPILIESLLNWMVGAVDTVLSAALSEPAADAIGGGAYIGWFMGLMGMATGVGATAVVSRCVGKGRMGAANAAVGQSMLLAAALGAATGALVALAAPLIGALLGLQGAALEHLIVYLRIMSLGAPALSVMMVGIACCRGAGDSLRPLGIMAGVNIVNVGVSWVIAGVDITRTTFDSAGEPVTRVLLNNPFPFTMGVAGIAIGTVVAWCAGALAVSLLLLDGRSGVRLFRRRLRPHLTTMTRVVRIAMPNFLEMLGMWAGNFLIIMMVGWMLAPGLLGSHIVAIRIEAISFLPGFSMAIASATLVGQWLGAGDAKMAERAVWRCAGVAAAIMGVVGLMFVLFPRQITALFTPQATHLEYVPQLIFIAGLVQAPFALGIVLRSALRGAGDAKVVMWLTWITTWGVRLPLAYFISGVDVVVPDPSGEGMRVLLENPSPFNYGLVGLWWGLCIELVIRAALFSGRFMQGKWKTMRV